MVKDFKFFISPCDKIIKRNILKKAYFNSNYRVFEDLYCSIEIYLNTNINYIIKADSFEKK